MLVTGYELKRALEHWELLKGIAKDKFQNELEAFPENKGTKIPLTRAQEYLTAEQNIVILQVAQQYYNSVVTVNIDGKKHSLAHAIKMKGVWRRYRKEWENALAVTRGFDNRGFYTGRTHRVRKEDETYLVPILTEEVAEAHFVKAAKNDDYIRAIIAEANGETVEIEGLDESLVAIEGT